MKKNRIQIRGASQNNLKNLDLDVPLGQLVVVTGVSGSGKSSLAFDTIYSEGQRRYVETFSPYARQFLDRMDKPQAESIDGIPPAIAIDQTNPVRTSRSTVGTMTELNDHLKLLFARASTLYCRQCASPVDRDNAQSIVKKLLDAEVPGIEPDDRAMISFDVPVPHNFEAAEVRAALERQGYLRFHSQSDTSFEVVQDRLAVAPRNRERIVEGLEAALRHGAHQVKLRKLTKVESTTPAGQSESSYEPGEAVRFSADFHCAACDLRYREPFPSLFSFNSPAGACETCRGFGRTMAIDLALVIPDERKTLAQGAVKPWQSKSYLSCQKDLLRHARSNGIPVDRPWGELEDAQRRWVIDGEGSMKSKRWYGVRRFFDWLETKSYRMHVRVLLSRYRSYNQCDACGGARLRPEALLWRVDDRKSRKQPVSKMGSAPPDCPRPDRQTPKVHAGQLPGLNIHDVVSLPLASCRKLFANLTLSDAMDDALAVLLEAINSRLSYLDDVGLGYLTLDRQSRTLSGGEVQRINLTTALGTSLVNTLFVLDEPSIGLHARDMNRVVGVLHRLRDAGNSLIVVEHDAKVMLAADRIIDMGPGPGENGGEIVFAGTPMAMMRSTHSITGQYLSGQQMVLPPSVTGSDRPRGVGSSTPKLRITAANENNLKNVDIALPLGRLVCVTGVSGSGKSTLIEDVLFKGLKKLKGQPGDAAGAHESISGHDSISEVVMVDQSPIGKTTRSNPASYMGALTGIRKLFAEEALSLERGYTAGTFSFNSGNGRCPACGGNGFEHVEMQFLSDVYLRCPDCDGKRYRPEVLEVKLLPIRSPNDYDSDDDNEQNVRSPLSIADVLDLTVTEAVAFFCDHPEVGSALGALARVGLGYLRLGQPVPTLSGGESQRLKLAAHLSKAQPSAKPRSKAAASAPLLLLFDEPTTGLHFCDVTVLLGAFEELVREGHSVFIIEHHIDLIAACDWIVDLGPEGGDHGGEIVAQGTPTEVASCRHSHTGLALAELFESRTNTAIAVRDARTEYASPTASVARPLNRIEIRNAREHNLRNIDVSIPHGKFTVISGVSGSGKSTVAFDILFNEGQRRYLESLNAYARQFVQPAARPEVDAVLGIPPTVAIEQRTSRGGRKSTVATLTEVYHFLRLLFVKLGVQHCPDCDLPIEPQSEDALVASLMRRFKGTNIKLLSPLVVSRKGYYTDLARWASRKGYPLLEVDGEEIDTGAWPRLDRFKEHDIDLPIATVAVNPAREAELRTALQVALSMGKGAVKVSAGKVSADRGSKSNTQLYSTARSCPGCARSFGDLDPRQFSFNSRHGWCHSCFGTGLVLPGFDAEQTGEEGVWLEPGVPAPRRRGAKAKPSAASAEPRTCRACAGHRLNSVALAVRFDTRNITDLNGLSVKAALGYVDGLKLDQRALAIARDVLAELRSRLEFLDRVGLGYLGLDRAAPTLSGGEAQRIRLAAQLGSNLRGVCYILDEPTIGLHTRDNKMLLDTLRALKQKGNTVVVVEHDEDTIRSADHVIDLGPGAGTNGGHVVAHGTIKALQRSKASLTGKLLREPLRHPLLDTRRPVSTSGRGKGDPSIHIKGAHLHNLKHINADIPLSRLVCVTGVSGSGKSSLVRGVLARGLHQTTGTAAAARSKRTPVGCEALTGLKNVQRVLEVDQTPIGKTPRSCPATYIGIWDHIRRIFAETSEARIRGHGPSRFSFNVKGGRCEACEGQGRTRMEMSFLPDVRVPCDVCGGRRFGRDTLDIEYRERNIGDVLAMSVDEAADFFIAHTRVHQALCLLQDVGLGYLTLGQPSPTLSGGEAQRIKLVTELTKARIGQEAPMPKADSQRRAAHTLYVLDEPTIGLHMADVEKLIRVLHRLVDAGNSVVVIEHNLDVIAEADHVIDMGPEGGTAGGSVVASGTPEAIAKARIGHTGRALAEFLGDRSGPGPTQSAT